MWSSGIVQHSGMRCSLCTLHRRHHPLCVRILLNEYQSTKNQMKSIYVQPAANQIKWKFVNDKKRPDQIPTNFPAANEYINVYLLYINMDTALNFLCSIDTGECAHRTLHITMLPNNKYQINIRIVENSFSNLLVNSNLESAYSNSWILNSMCFFLSFLLLLLLLLVIFQQLIGHYSNWKSSINMNNFTWMLNTVYCIFCLDVKWNVEAIFNHFSIVIFAWWKWPSVRIILQNRVNNKFHFR